MTVLIINSLFLTIRSFAEIRINRELAESGFVSMERITREIREAQGVNMTDSILSTNPGILKLNSLDQLGNPRIIEFYVDNLILKLKENNILAGSLIGENVEKTNLIFELITTNQGEAIKTEMFLRSKKENNQIKNFYNTTILRGEY